MSKYFEAIENEKLESDRLLSEVMSKLKIAEEQQILADISTAEKMAAKLLAEKNLNTARQEFDLAKNNKEESERQMSDFNQSIKLTFEAKDLEARKLRVALQKKVDALDVFTKAEQERNTALTKRNDSTSQKTKAYDLQQKAKEILSQIVGKKNELEKQQKDKEAFLKICSTEKNSAFDLLKLAIAHEDKKLREKNTAESALTEEKRLEKIAKDEANNKRKLELEKLVKENTDKYNTILQEKTNADKNLSNQRTSKNLILNENPTAAEIIKKNPVRGATADRVVTGSSTKPTSTDSKTVDNKNERLLAADKLINDAVLNVDNLTNKLNSAQRDKTSAENNLSQFLTTLNISNSLDRTGTAVFRVKSEKELTVEAANKAYNEAVNAREKQEKIYTEKTKIVSDLDAEIRTIIAELKNINDLEKPNAETNLATLTNAYNNAVKIESDAINSYLEKLNSENIAKRNLDSFSKLADDQTLKSNQTSFDYEEKKKLTSGLEEKLKNSKSDFEREERELLFSEERLKKDSENLSLAIVILNSAIEFLNKLKLDFQAADKKSRAATRLLNNLQNGGPIVADEQSSYATTEKYLQRPNHFEGQFVKEEHLLTEQDYLDFIRQTTNRYLNDISGILTGFTLEIDPSNNNKILISSGLGQYIDKTGKFSIIKEVCLLKSESVNASGKRLTNGKYIIYAVSSVLAAEDQERKKPEYKKMFVQFDFYKKDRSDEEMPEAGLKIGEFSYDNDRIKDVVNYPNIQKSIRKINNFKTAEDGSVTITGEDIVELVNQSQELIKLSKVAGTPEITQKIQNLELQMTQVKAKADEIKALVTDLENRVYKSDTSLEKRIFSADTSLEKRIFNTSSIASGTYSKNATLEQKVNSAINSQASDKQSIDSKVSQLETKLTQINNKMPRFIGL